MEGHAQPNDIPPAGRARGWWNFGGILREVYLRKVGKLDLGDPQIDNHGGRARAQVKFGGAR